MSQRPSLLTNWKIRDKRGHEFIVRPLNEHDAQLFSRFFSTLSQHSKNTFQPHPFTPKFINKMTQDARSPYHLRLVVIDPAKHNQIIGYAFVTRPPLLTQLGYFGIAISDSYQGRGISTLLMKKLFSYAQQHGVKRIYLNVFANNERAIKAYQRLTFKTIPSPGLIGKVFTLYELWYNQMLGELLTTRSIQTTHTASPVWMVKQLG